LDEDVNLDDDLRRHWENIIADADIDEIPFHFLKCIDIKMLNQSNVCFNITEMSKELAMEVISRRVSKFMNENENQIDSVDFHINVGKVAHIVGKKTKGLLG